MRVLVTGASGFVGGAVINALAEAGHEPVAALRRRAPDGPGRGRSVVIGDIGPQTDWTEALDGVDVVIHGAALTAGEGVQVGPIAAEVFRVNRGGTDALARAAAGRIARFIHISTVKVLGEVSGGPLAEDAPHRPADLYAASKAEAEDAARRALAPTPTGLIILRPPLVYGPPARGNFARLARLARRGLPLPFGLVANRRSLCFVDNLAHAAVAALTAPPGTYHVADATVLSTPDWIDRLARLQGARARLVPVPPSLLRQAFGVLGRPGLAQRLLDDLELGTERSVPVLGPPPIDLDEGFRRTLAAPDRTAP